MNNKTCGHTPADADTAENTNPAGNPGANRLIETIRRIILVAGIAGTVWSALCPADALLRVQAVDFAKMQKKQARRMASNLSTMSRESGMPLDQSLNTTANTPLEQYIEEMTRNRLHEVEGQAWLNFHNAVADTQTGRDTRLAKHLGHTLVTGYLYFNPATTPLNSIATKLGDNQHLLFVAVRDRDTTRYLEVLFQRPGDMHRYAPAWLCYPLRKYAVFFFLAALLGYALLPWHKAGPHELCYSKASQIVIPDLLGTTMASFFFALPVLIITANAPGQFAMFDFSLGWGVLTSVMWAIATGLLSIVVVALWYSVLSIVLLPDGILKRNLFGARHFPYSQIESVGPAILDWPKWLKALAWITVLFGATRSKLLVGGMLLSRQTGFGLLIRCRSGAAEKIWLNGLPGFAQLFNALRKAGIPIDPEVASILENDLAEAPTPEAAAKRAAIGRTTARILLCLAIGAALALHFTPAKVPTIDRRLEFSNEELAQRMAITKQMKQVADEMATLNNEMKQLLADPAKRNADRQAELMKAQDELMNRYQQLSREHDAIRPTEER